jgi:hypothetical protein
MASKTIEIDVKVDSSQAVKGVDDLSKSTDKLGKNVDGLTSSSEKLEEGLSGVSGGLDGAIGGAKALGKQFLALIANPIGAVIAGIAVVLGTLFKAFSRTESGGNKLNKGMNALTGVFNAFLKVIEPIASFLVDVFAEAFVYVGNEIDKFVTNLTGALKVLGLDGAAKSIDNFANSTSGLIDKTNELSDLEAKLLKTRREQGLIEKQALIDAEKLRQQRDDESNSLQERIEFNRQLSDVLQKQSKDELAISKDALRAAQLKLEIDGETTEALDGLAEAKLEILDIEERINGQLSEQLANENSLRNEGRAASAERIKQIEDETQARVDALERIKERERADIEAEEEEDFGDFEVDGGIDPELKAYIDLVNSKLEYDEEAALRKEQILREEVEAERAANEAKAQIQSQYIDSVSSGIKLLTSFAGESKAAQAVAIIAENAAGIAKMIISNNIANAGALATPQAIATSGAAAVPVITANNVTTGLSIAASIKATADGLSKLKAGGSAGSKPSLPSGGGGSASAPSINEDTLFSTQNLQGQESENIGEGAGINQIKAVVVESDITNVQKKINDIETASEIG